jgi:hypothetical protein
VFPALKHLQGANSCDVMTCDRGGGLMDITREYEKCLCFDDNCLES